MFESILVIDTLKDMQCKNFKNNVFKKARYYLRF